jgi:hypothetical protein
MSTARNYGAPTIRLYDVGFRLALDLTGMDRADADLDLSPCFMVNRRIVSDEPTGTYAAVANVTTSHQHSTLSARLCYQIYNVTDPVNETDQLFLAADWQVLATIASGHPGANPGITAEWSNQNIALSLGLGLHTLYVVRTAAANEAAGRIEYEQNHGGWRVSVGSLWIWSCGPGVTQYVVADQAGPTYAAVDRVILNQSAPGSTSIDVGLRYQVYATSFSSRHQLFLASELKVLATIDDSVSRACPGVVTTWFQSGVNLAGLSPGLHNLYVALVAAGSVDEGQALYESTGVATKVAVGAVTVGDARKPTLLPEVVYAPATRTLRLMSRAIDPDGNAVGSGTLNWSLRDAGGAEKAAGTLAYSATDARWAGGQTLTAALPPGSYTVAFSLATPTGATASASRPITVAATYSVTGQVLDKTTGNRLSGVQVSMGGNTGQTDTQGKYTLSGIDVSTLPGLTATRAGYAQYAATLNPPPSGTSIVHDFNMVPADGSKPAVTSLKAKYEGHFLLGVDVNNPYTATVDWNGQPRELRVYVNGQIKTTVPASGGEVAFSLNMGRDFPGGLFGQTSRLGVVAVNTQGIQSDLLSVPVSVVLVPPGLQSLVNTGALIFGEQPDDLVWHFQFSWPPDTDDKRRFIKLPFLSEFGGRVAVDGEGEFKTRTGEWEITLGVTSGKYSKRYRRYGQTLGHPYLKAGSWKADVRVEGFGNGHLVVGQPLRLDEVGLSGSLSGEFLLWAFLFTDWIPGVNAAVRAIDALPGDLDPLSFLKANLYLTLDTGPTATFQWDPFEFKSFVWYVAPGLKAAYEPKLGDLIDGELYAGGKLEGNIEIVPPPVRIFENLSGSIYGGVSLRVWMFTFGPYEAVFLKYPGTQAKGDATELSSTLVPLQVRLPDPCPKPLCRDYLMQGLPRFVAYSGAIRSAAGDTGLMRGGAGKSATGIEAFRAMRHAGAGKTREMGRAALGEGDSSPPQADLSLLENVCSRSDPSLAAEGADLMLVYVSDNGAPGDLQFTDINWTHFDGTDWTEPAPIQADTRAEFAPRVAFDGNGDAVAVWERVKDPNFNAADVTIMATEMEIAWSRWDHTTGMWAEPATLTDNHHLDHAPLLCGPMADGSLLAVWTENTLNRLMGEGVEGADSNSHVLWARWDSTTRNWGPPQTLIASLPYRTSQSLAGAGSTAVYAWTRDVDGDLATARDLEVFSCEWNGAAWTAPTQRTNDLVPDRTVRVAVSAAGVIYLVWQQGGDLVMDVGFAGAPTLARADSQTAGFADYTVALGPAGNLLLIWQEQSDTGVDAHYSVYDPASGRWSKAAQLFNDPPLERSFSPVWDDVGNLALAYNRVEITSVTKTVTLESGEVVQIEQVPAPGQVDVGVLKRRIVADLAVLPGDFAADGASFLPGDQVRLASTVRNTGDLALENIAVAFYDGDPSAGGVEIARQVIPGWLDGSAEAVVEVEWTVPAPAGVHTLFVVVDRDDTVSEFDEQNNQQALTVGGTDLSIIVLSTTAYSGGWARIIVQAANSGAAAPETVVAVRRAGETGVPLVSATLPALDSGHTAQLPLDLPPGTLSPNKLGFSLTVDDTGVAADINRANNTVTFTVVIPSVPADAEGDGDVDMQDYAGFQGCLSGPAMPYPEPACASLDFDADGDVDQSDYGVFQRCFSGSQLLGDPNCAD